VDEKQNVETVVKNRVEKVRQEKEKNAEIEQMKEKFEKLFNFELENIHKSQ
jgi:hypothetical protein